MRRTPLVIFMMLTIAACPGDDSPAETESSTTADTDPTTTMSTTAMPSTSMSTTASTTMDTDPDTDTTDGESSSSDTSGDTDGSSSSEGSSGSESSSTGGGALEMCLENAETDCGMCACNECLTETLACDADAGCVAIRDCARETGCSGIGCYQPDTCMDVIDDNGGLVGASTGLAADLSDCTTAGCADRCAD